MTMRMPLEPCWVLHTRPYRETSLIVELLTPGFGRVDAVLRGARGRRRSAVVIRQFQPFLVAWAGRGSLKSLHQVEPDGAVLELGGDALIAGLYVNELLLRVLKPMDPHENLFGAYAGCLAEIAGDGLLAPALRRFEREVLSAIGYEISFRQVASNGTPIQPNGEYVIVPDSGFMLPEDAPPGTGAATYPGSALLAIAGNDYSQASVRSLARGLLRELLEPHLGGYPLRSSRLLAATRGSGEASLPDRSDVNV